MINKQTICPNCSSKEIIKRGILKTENKGNKQRYGCKECNHRFIQDEPFKRMRNQDKKITLCLDLYYSGLSLRKIAKHLRVFYPNSSDPSTIYRWIMKYVGVMANFTDKQKIQLGLTLEGDEVEYHRLGHKNFFVDIIDTKTRYVVYSKYIQERTTDELIKIYKKVRIKTGGQTKMICTDGLLSYPEVLRKTFGLNKSHRRNPKIIHNVTLSKSGRSGSFNYKIERFHNTLRERTKTMRGFHGCISSAQTLMKGFEIYYNYIREHSSLGGKSPCEIAVPNLKFNNENRWIEIIEGGYNRK